MRRSFAMLGMLALALPAIGLSVILPSEETRAASSAQASFVVPSDDGYGVAECATASCGKVIADQWCVAQGYASALDYGLADAPETTGTITVKPVRTAPETRAFVVTCAR